MFLLSYSDRYGLSLEIIEHNSLTVAKYFDLYEVHEDKLAEHSGDTQQRQAVAHVEDGVLQTELLGEAVNCDDELYAVCLKTKRSIPVDFYNAVCPQKCDILPVFGMG